MNYLSKFKALLGYKFYFLSLILLKIYIFLREDFVCFSQIYEYH